jgi:hypothetical protein
VIELHGSQVQGHHVLRYAVAVGDVDPYAMVEDAFVPLLVTAGGALGALPDEYQALDVSGAQVSAVFRRDGALHVRVFNPTEDAATLLIRGRTGVVVDLRDRVCGWFDGRLDLTPWQIATIRLD